MKDARGHGSDARGGENKLKANWLSAALAAMRAHYTGGAINQEPHSNGVHALPDANGKPGGKPSDGTFINQHGRVSVYGVGAMARGEYAKTPGPSKPRGPRGFGPGFGVNPSRK
jgi:hypothetical protein